VLEDRGQQGQNATLRPAGEVRLMPWATDLLLPKIVTELRHIAEAQLLNVRSS
jgi:hypothetical protein